MVRLGVLTASLLPLTTNARPSEPLGACDPRSGIDADQVFITSDSGYDEARLDQYASMLGTHADASAALKPGILVKVVAEAQVQSAVRFASRCGYKVNVRSGGHSYSGSSSCHSDRCLQLDLQTMNATSVHGRMITAEPGIRLTDFAKHTLKHLLSVPHGGCTRVGMGGHLQSSAWGMMTHSWGSGMDHVESFRMVLADGSVQRFARNDTNDTVYRSVLGSAPGSWGILTQFVLKGVPDTDVPFVRVMTVRIYFSRESVLAAMKQTQFICQDQEALGLRDMKILLIIAPPTENVEEGIYITVYAMWTGIDSGIMGPHWRTKYMQPFWDLPHSLLPPATLDLPLDLSTATRMFVNPWTNDNDRYAVEAFHSDHWWDDEFLEEIADELVERADLFPEAYPSWQFLPLGQQTQWARNEGMNSLTWRDTRQYVDDWMFVKNDSRYEEITARMRNFRERTRKYWQHSDGSDRSTWMSPKTIYPNSTDIHDRSIAKSYFPNDTQFEQLRLLKAELDPTDLFSSKSTIPLPGDMYDEVKVV